MRAPSGPAALRDGAHRPPCQASAAGRAGRLSEGDPVIVWLWDANGPDRDYAGVTDNLSQALTSAQTLLSDRRASTARIEQAYARMGGLWIHSGYERTGTGQTAAPADNGTVTWTPFHRPALAAS